MCIYNVLLYLSSFKINGVRVMNTITDCTCDYCGHDWKCELSVSQSMACPGCGDRPYIKPSKPAYTQAMADNGELPLVGMEVMSMGVNKIVRLPPDTNRRFLLESVVMGIYDLALIEGISAIKPPIELVDGKAYQFDVGDRKIEAAIYFKETNRFHRGTGFFQLIQCTNIQLLEVKS